MGNKESKGNVSSNRSDGVYKQKENRLNQFGVSFNSLKSITTLDNQRSTNSVLRPWSSISRRRWRKSTLTYPYEFSKTTWPVSQLESYFLPEFPICKSQKDNKFETLQQISSGAFGKVYKIRDLETNEIFALKFLSKSKIIGDNSIKQVKEEVQIHKACGHHPFIVKCPLNWQSRKHLYIVTEYIEGGELWNLLNIVGILPTEVVQLYVAQIALAIDFLHNAGIIYRDLKPENILLDVNANIKLIDFGLSKWLPYGHTTSTVCGTPNYMAPEVVRMEFYSHAVDWWSLGVIACLMLTGKMPKLDINFNTYDSAGLVTLPQDVFLDVPSRDLLLRLLEIQPHKRLRSVRMLSTIAFYMGYNIEDIREIKVKAKDLLVKHFGENYNTVVEDEDPFKHFDETLIPE